MELWIRSKDKKCLTMVNHLYIDDNHHIRQQDDLILGTYETKRALEILDEIEKLIKPITIFQNCQVDKSTIEKIKETGYCVVNNDARVEQFSQVFYEMPKE